MSDTDTKVLDQSLSASRRELASTMPEDEFWEMFMAKEILRDYRLDPDDIQSGIVGQRAGETQESDGGKDSFYLLINGTPLRDLDQARDIRHKMGIVFDVIIIQSKLCTGFSLAAINRLSNTCESIFRIELQSEEFPENITLDC